jgi:peptidoglycan-N-acetylglucosamine deacetylase
MMRMAFRLFRPAIGTITCASTNEPIAALTFDDGPHPLYTPILLDILRRHRARATFFLVGEAAAKHPEIVREIRESGHAIGLHSWDHTSFTAIRRRERIEQIRACEKVLAGKHERLFRPPWGTQSIASRLDMFQLGYKVVGWNVAADDWLPVSRDHIATSLISQMKPGSIVILHDAIYRSIFSKPQTDRTEMIAGLDQALTTVRDRLNFVTIPELVTRGRPRLERVFKSTP